jgi:hypothetical protein
VGRGGSDGVGSRDWLPKITDGGEGWQPGWPLAWLWQQRKRVHVRRPDHSEVPAVQRRHLGQHQPFRPALTTGAMAMDKILTKKRTPAPHRRARNTPADLHATPGGRARQPQDNTCQAAGQEARLVRQ